MALLPARFRSAFEVLRFRNYLYYASGSFISASGLWMQRIAVGWLTWELTGSGFWLGAIAMADLFPSIVVGPIGGALADRFDRLRLTRLIQVLSLAQSAVLVGLLIAGLINIWLLFGLTLFLGIVQAFGISVQLALVPSLIPRDRLPSAVALNSVAFTSARFVGPAIGGLVIAHGGVTVAIAANTITFAIFLALLARIVPISSEIGGRERHGLFSDIVAGLRYVTGHGGIAPMLILLMAISMGGRAITEILPKFSAVVLGGGASDFANMVAAIGIGGVVAGLWMSGRGEAAGLTRLAILLTLGQAVTLMVLPFTSSLVMVLPIMVVLGFVLGAAGIANQTQIQLAVDGAMRGRVMSLYGMIFRGGPGLGALIIGLASDYLGIRIPIFCAGLAVAAVVLWVWLRRHRVAAALESAAGAPSAGG